MFILVDRLFSWISYGVHGNVFDVKPLVNG